VLIEFEGIFYLEMGTIFFLP